MSKRVNLQYSVRIEDLPYELNRLQDIAKSHMNRVQSMMDKRFTHDLSDLEKISFIRQEMSHMDLTLSDLHRIIGAYAEYKIQLIRETEENYEEQNEDDISVESNEQVSLGDETNQQTVT